MRDIALIAIALSTLTSPVSAQLFLDPTVGLYQQTVTESLFLAAVPYPGQLVSFDELGPVPMLAGSEWAVLGVTLSSPAGIPIFIGQTGPTGSANSQPHYVATYTYPAATPEDYHFDFSPPLNAVSFWLIDSEDNPGGIDRVRFVDAGGQPLLDIPMPATGATMELGIQGNYFIGYISPTPIARLEIVENGPDGDGVGVDDLRLIPFGAPVHPGTGDGLLLATSVSTAPLSAVPFDVKTVMAGGTLSLRFHSPDASLAGYPYLLLGQVFPTGSPPVGFFPGVQLSLGGLVVLLDGIAPNPLFGQPLLPPGGINYAFSLPPTLIGSSVMIQAFAITLGPPAQNGFFASSDAHEIQVL